MKNLLLPACLLLLLFSCRKESFTTNAGARITSNVDTLHFDTVFTTTGSVTQAIKIFNANKDGIRLSAVRVGGGAASPFKINVDGTPGPLVNNVELPGNDSLYIYVTVTINPNAQNTPFVVRDSIELLYNGNKTYVQLDAYGRNAHFLRNRKIAANETWNATLPYVILGGLTVDTNATLTIEKGARIFIHADAPFRVNGSLRVLGERYDSTRVIFTGDRLDAPYSDFPASYPGLIFSASSHHNYIQYAIIKNAYQGIVITGPAVSGTKLQVNETSIENAYDAGLLAINTSLQAQNLLIANCGRNMVLAAGGSYQFTHCTLAAFSTQSVAHKEPVLLITNFSTQGNSMASNDLTASFRNCIFWGEQNGFVKNEVVAEKQGNTPYNLLFENVLWRNQVPPANATINNALSGEPLFDSINTARRYFNFHLKENSPAVNAGKASSVLIDLDGKSRPVGAAPDLGVYEWRP